MTCRCIKAVAIPDEGFVADSEVVHTSRGCYHVSLLSCWHDQADEVRRLTAALAASEAKRVEALEVVEAATALVSAIQKVEPPMPFMGGGDEALADLSAYHVRLSALAALLENKGDRT